MSAALSLVFSGAARLALLIAAILMVAATAGHQAVAPKPAEELVPRPDHFPGPLRALRAAMTSAEDASPAAVESANPSMPQRVALLTPWLGRNHRFLDLTN